MGRLSTYIPPLLLSCSLMASSNEVTLHAAYTYWWAGEEGLGLGRSGNFLEGDDPFYNLTTDYLSQPFRYQSGFIVGAAWNRNDWTLDGTYTCVRNRITQNSLAPLLDPDFGTGVWLIAPWFLQIGEDGGSLSGTAVTSTWQLAMDIGDLQLGYSCPVGSRLTLSPYGGLRSAWIRQKMEIDLVEPLELFPTLPNQPIHSSTGSNSWSIGPRFGSEADLSLGYGMRLEGNLGLSLLWTKYTNLFHREDEPTPGTFPGSLYAEQKDQYALRPVLESSLGMGWSSSGYSKRFVFDVAATYDFMLWWNQNVMREFLNSLWNQSPVNGDLYLHGLTLSTQIRF